VDVDVCGKVAVVTGGASGLGLAVSTTLAQGGCRVVILDLPTSPGASVAADLGDAARFAPADITDPGAVTSALGAAAEFGELRVLVNCAGIASARRTLSQHGPFPLDDFARVVAVNLVGTFNVIRLAAERMASYDIVDGERGVIVNTASIAAFDGQIGQAAYAASKAGIAGLTLPVARDLATSAIRVVTIAPGLFDTPLLAGLPQSARESLGQQVPHPSRLGRPEEFSALVAHIVANQMLNGETIRLDGALRMPPR
jgi:NAD(P)-dependent dehydrogenase (short-subunit alcohol dehydrogenase family)